MINPIQNHLAKLLVLSALINSSSASANEFHREMLDRYADYMGLPKLGSQDGDSLRIWVHDVLLGELQGYVVTNSRSLQCLGNGNIQPMDEPHRARCIVTTQRTQPKNALSLLGRLEKLDGKEIDCGVQDGDAVYVEGMHDGHIFEFYSGNPGSCSDSDSALVTKAIALVKPHRVGTS
jgi:hypothetical protein